MFSSCSRGHKHLGCSSPHSSSRCKQARLLLRHRVYSTNSFTAKLGSARMSLAASVLQAPTTEASVGAPNSESVDDLCESTRSLSSIQ